MNVRTYLFLVSSHFFPALENLAVDLDWSSRLTKILLDFRTRVDGVQKVRGQGSLWRVGILFLLGTLLLDLCEVGVQARNARSEESAFACRVQVVLNGVLGKNLWRDTAGGQQIAGMLKIGIVKLMDHTDEGGEAGDNLWWCVLAWT